MTDVDYERVSREFLGYTKLLWPAPGPTWDFFGKCWDECVKRGWMVLVTNRGVDLDTMQAAKDQYDAYGDPRVALPACIIQRLDAQRGGDD